MNPFISISEFSYGSQDNFIPVFCSNQSSLPARFIPRSFFYHVEDNAVIFTSNCCSLEIDDDKTIICYDSGDLNSACKAYWGFKATGHDNVKVLLGGIKNCEKHRINLVSGAIPDIRKGDTACLPFNEDTAMTFQRFSYKEAITEQVLEAKKLTLEITDPNGEILPQSQLVKLLRESEIEYKPNKMTVVHGKNAFLVGMILIYLGERMISVVIEDTTGFVSAKKNRQTIEYKKQEPKPKSEEQTSRICSGCVIY
jgi:hypothetical protein